jgi:hypothetical protein
MKTYGEQLRAAADRIGTPLRTVEQVRACLEKAKQAGAYASMARLMLNHGRLTDDARDFVRKCLGCTS